MSRTRQGEPENRARRCEAGTNQTRRRPTPSWPGLAAPLRRRWRRLQSTYLKAVSRIVAHGADGRTSPVMTSSAASRTSGRPLIRYAPSPRGMTARALRGRRHADDPARRRRLRHAAVRAERLVGDAGVDEFHQPRPRRLRHGRRLCHGAADEPRRRSVPRHAAGRLSHSGALGVALERTLYRRLYGASPLDQVLFTIGLVFMAMPIADYCSATSRSRFNLPAWLHGRIEIHGVSIGVYRLFIIVGVRRDRGGAADIPGQDPLRRATESGSRRRARRSGLGDQRRPHLRHRFRGRQRPRRPGRGVGRRCRRRHRSRRFR